MTLRDADSTNFDTLLQASRNGGLMLLECRDARTGEYRAVVCAVVFDGAEYAFTPLAQMITGNPFEDYIPPKNEEVST